MKLKIILFLSLLSLFIFSSCKKETTSPIETIPQNLFPLKTGNAWFYTGYQIDTAGNKISGTEFNSSTTIVGQIQFEGKNPFLVIDSLKYQRGPEIDTLLIYLENDYLYAWIDLTNMVSIPGFTYKRWVPFIKTTGALNEPYTILNLDTTIIVTTGGQQLPLNIRVNITGNIALKEEIQTPLGKFVAYKFEANVTGSASIGGVTVGTFTSKNYIWLSPGIGPVKHETPATATQPGIRRELSNYRIG
jgi:hypothetical protein